MMCVWRCEMKDVWCLCGVDLRVGVWDNFISCVG